MDSIALYIDDRGRSVPCFALCHLRLGSWANNLQYPKQINTLVDRIRVRRFDLNLLQRQVADQIGVHARRSFVSGARLRSSPPRGRSVRPAVKPADPLTREEQFTPAQEWRDPTPEGRKRLAEAVKRGWAAEKNAATTG